MEKILKPNKRGGWKKHQISINGGGVFSSIYFPPPSRPVIIGSGGGVRVRKRISLICLYFVVPIINFLKWAHLLRVESWRENEPILESTDDKGYKIWRNRENLNFLGEPSPLSPHWTLPTYESYTLFFL